ncbi:MAG: hypothetical protein HRT71_01990 [Flavobacteriales bacterium]|nr:hypothetical protein [Flavobacteriales bacterium]
MRFSIFILSLIAILASSCRKDSDVEYIPDVYVNITIFPTNPSKIELNAVGGWIEIEGGSRGIIIYRATNEDFVVFDRHCPYDVNNTCGKVTMNNQNLFAVDSCCSSHFLILDGSAYSGPATLPLKQYNTNWDGNQLVIFN